MSLRKKSHGARLKHSVKELLFSATGPPVRASELKTLGKVLDAFTKYETTRVRENTHVSVECTDHFHVHTHV